MQCFPGCRHTSIDCHIFFSCTVQVLDISESAAKSTVSVDILHLMNLLFRKDLLLGTMLCMYSDTDNNMFAML